MSGYTGLMRRGAVYWFRMRIPQDLLGQFGKSKEITHTLGTRDLAEAKRLYSDALAAFNKKMDAARARRDAVEVPALPDSELEKLSQEWLRSVLQRDEQFRQGGISGWHFEDYGRALETVNGRFRRALAQGDGEQMAGEADSLLAERGIKLARDSESYRKLTFLLLKANIRVGEMLQRRQAGEIVDTPVAQSWVALPPQSPTGPTLNDLFTDWIAARKPPEKTRLEFARAIRRFDEFSGTIPAAQIEKAQLREFKKALAKFPRVLTADLLKLSFTEVLEVVEKKPPARLLSQGTLKKHIGAISAVLTWAEGQGYFDKVPGWRNPAANLGKGEKQAQVERKRLPYDDDDLKIIFGSPIYTAGERPAAGCGEAAYWLPLLGLYTGARLEELGQLLPSDVKHQHDVHYIDINTVEDGKRLKNAGSHRKVPLHPRLIELGFLQYVQEMKRAEAPQLFLALKRDKLGSITGNWSKWFGRWTHKIGITDARKVFHSFRHRFKDACRDAEISEEIHDALTGHSGNRSIARTYGLGVGDNLRVLHLGISRISLPV